MKICISCEAHIPDDAEVCDHCGQVLRVSMSGKMEAIVVFPPFPAPLYTEDEVKGAEEGAKEETSPVLATPPVPLYSDLPTSFSQKHAVASPFEEPYGEESSISQKYPVANVFEESSSESEMSSLSQKHAVASAFEEPYSEVSSKTETPSTLGASMHLQQRWHWIFILACLLVIFGSVGTFLIMHVHARDFTGSTLMVAGPAAHLRITPGSLDFGQVPESTRVVLVMYVANTGKKALNWQVDSARTPWLGVKTNSGVIQPGALPQPVYTFVDTTKLTPGPYSGIEHILSNGGTSQIQVKLMVIPAGVKQEAKLSINPNSINFGSMQVGQQMSSQVTVGNLGNAALHWKASTQNTSWLSLDSTSGTIIAGGLPQSFNVTANTSQLSPGNYSAVVPITSNGGNIDIGITLAVPGNSAPISSLTITPASLDSHSANCTSNSNGGFNCTVTLANASQGTVNWSSWTNIGGDINPSSGQLFAGQRVSILLSAVPCKNGSFTFIGVGSNEASVSWSCSTTSPPAWSVSPTSSGSNCSAGCTLTLSENAGSTGSIDWSASSNVGVTFNPGSGILSPDQSQQVIVTQGTCKNGTLTFTGSGGVKTLTVAWNCPPPPSPSLNWSVSPTSLDASTCGITTSCQVTLSEDSSSTGTINWSASTDTGATFSSSSGMLSPGQTQPITISGLTCRNGTITFSASGVSALSVTWTCTPDAQQLSVTPSSFSDGCVSCTVTLTSMSNTSAITWSASSDMSGVSFSPASGTLAPGQSVNIGITPNQTCPASGNFLFSGPGNTASVSWSCSGSNLTVGPTSFSPTGCTTSNGNWQCILTLTSDPNNQGTLSWSASVNGGSGITLSQYSGQLNPGGEVQIVALIPQSNCPGSGQMSFQGSANVATTTWSC